MIIQHHRQSIRLKEFDYTAPGVYFVTIVTFERRNLFGEVLNNPANLPVVLLNDVGLVVQREWERLPHRFPGISLDKFIIMPNHFHGIIVIEDNRPGLGYDHEPGRGTG